MATKFAALLIIVVVMGMLFAAGGTGAARSSSPTVTATHVAALATPTREATAEATVQATAEVTQSVLVGDPVRGEAIFRHGLDGAPPCVTCHSPTTSGRGTFSIGPGLKGIGERGATRVEGLTAPEYIEDSIRHPADFLVPGFNPVMPGIFGEQYSDQDIADLVAFLMSL